MNRKERRRAQTDKKDLTINVTLEYIDGLLTQARKDAVKDTVKLMSAVFALGLNNELYIEPQGVNKVLDRTKKQLECIYRGDLLPTEAFNWCEENKIIIE